MAKLKVFCEICFEHIANVEESVIAHPLTGAMFEPREEGYSPPFPDTVDWEYMRCPYGPHRPFLRDSMIMTDKGLYVLLPPGEWERRRQEALRESLKEAATKVNSEVNSNGTEEDIEGSTGTGEEAGSEEGEGEQKEEAVGAWNSGRMDEVQVYMCEVCGKEFPSRKARAGHSAVHKRAPRG